MNSNKTSIGIWGFGIVGKATASFLHERGAQLTVMDNRSLTPEELQFLTEKNIAFVMQNNSLYSFLEQHDYIITSPGIDIRPYYTQYAHKWITELDIFMDHWQKPIIAITGSVGKTTVTSYVSQLLTKVGKNICTGGNIGIGSLDLIKNRDVAEYAVLEVADVQLRYAKQFAPDLAIWTNFYPNHLDWHNSLHDYFKAKCNLLANQTEQQQALVPADLLPTIRQQINPIGIIHTFTTKPPSSDFLQTLSPHALCFTIHNNMIIAANAQAQFELCAVNQLPPITFLDNWLVILGTCYLLQLSIAHIIQCAQQIQIPEHRLEKVATVCEVEFYNDSKSTIVESTRAALDKLNHQSIILFLGGLSKGVDRAPFIKELAGKVKAVYCFGAQAQTLVQYCRAAGIYAASFTSLDDAFHACTKKIVPGDYVLFSPAGSSHDLFKNYQERGKRFKQLVYEYASSYK